MDLVKVNFHGDELLAARDASGRVLVPIKRVCEVLGVNADGQRVKLGSKAWARTEMVSVRDDAGRLQDTFCIDLKSLPMWLATIEASRVAPAVRPKLERYQNECADALAVHFFGRRDQDPDASHVTLMIGAAFDRFATAMLAMEERAERREASLELRMLDAIDKKFAAQPSTFGGVIGRAGANAIRSQLREYADLWTGEPRTVPTWKSRHKKGERELRDAVGHSFRAWGLLPVGGAEGEATRKLASMLLTARDIASDRQPKPPTQPDMFNVVAISIKKPGTGTND